MESSRRKLFVRVQKGGFMVDLLLRWKIGPNAVFETLEIYTYIYNIVRSSVRPVVSVPSTPSSSVLCPSVPSGAVVVLCPSVRSVVRPVVLVRPLSVRPIVVCLLSVRAGV